MTAERSTMKSTSDPQTQALLNAQRKAHRNQPGSFKEDALTEKVVSVEPDGTGPTPTETFDTDKDKRKGSGSGPA